MASILKTGRASRKTKMKIRATKAIDIKATALMNLSANQSENLNFLLAKET
jgi:hypothetical protein